MNSFRSLLALCLALALAACPKAASASPPHGVTASLHLDSDTAKATLAQPCNGNAATVKCRATAVVTFAGQPVPVTIPDVTVGASWPVIAIPIACTPLKVVSISITLFGVNASGDVSSGVTLPTASATCVDSPPSNPANSVTVIIKSGGH